ncbi:class II aldolase and Adducin N-terminal domain-containing protein [Exophiala viscosa]|uniref:Class II aldolase and Adducin N-terminal domain-containing protein n=1 Tax=Exophiala viscosa TaxID=2486360 RepID=A0AAN6E283_9EURO|nr:class II aldolase and Adducin N-terminal domain-containing protein [Exophiala viscosa]KAI1621893.1 class II aldolase and Adducin N-terminal domain-containing protein [Exophiala viscosa]
MADSDTLTNALRDLIWANHILHHHGVVDAYGHISIRHPTDSSVYIMCGYMAPAMVSSPSDLIQYHVSNSDPIDPDAQKGYSERFIHGEIFKRFPRVNCVVHSHAEEVLPYVVTTQVPLRAVYHMAGFLGSKPVKVFDIDHHYEHGDQRDMLVRNARFGAALAHMFGGRETPNETVVLMKRHGFTCVAGNLVTAVYRAIYTKINAEVQTKAMTMAKMHSYGVDGQSGFGGLTEEQGEGCKVMCETYQDKPWRLWVREVERNPLYENTLSEEGV